MLPSATSFEIMTFLVFHRLTCLAQRVMFITEELLFITTCDLWFLFLSVSLFPCDQFQKKEWFTDDAANSTIECINTTQTRNIIQVSTKINTLDVKRFYDFNDRGIEIWK